MSPLSCAASSHVVIHVMSAFLIVPLGHLDILVKATLTSSITLKLTSMSFFLTSEPKLEVHHVHTGSRRVSSHLWA